MPPRSSATRSTMAFTELGSATSQPTPMLLFPYRLTRSDAAAAAFSSSRSTTATSAPNSDSARQKWVPRIPTPPVTTATLPLRSKRSLYTYVLHAHGLSMLHGHAPGYQEAEAGQGILGVHYRPFSPQGARERVHEPSEPA